MTEDEESMVLRSINALLRGVNALNIRVGILYACVLLQGFALILLATDS